MLLLKVFLLQKEKECIYMSNELIYIDNFDGSPERPNMIDNPFVKGNDW